MTCAVCAAALDWPVREGAAAHAFNACLNERAYAAAAQHLLCMQLNAPEQEHIAPDQ